MDDLTKKVTFGWQPDLPDFRDFNDDTKNVPNSLKEIGVNQSLNSMFSKIGIKGYTPSKYSIPKKIDLRKWCSPIEDQGQLGSCTAQAGVGLVEFCERKAHGKHGYL